MGSKGAYKDDPKVWEESLTMTVEQAARLLGVSPRNATYLARSGKIPTIRVGKLYRVPKAKLMAMINGEDADSKVSQG